MSTTSNNKSDTELISLILSGEIKLFTNLIKRYEAKLMSYLSCRCHDSTTVDDIFQETCIAIYKNLSQYNTQFPFGAWIFGIARNKCNQYYRKVTPMGTASADIAVDLSTPVRQLITVESSNEFWQEAKRLLSDDLFSIFWLHYQEEQSIKDISQSCRMTESNVKVSLFRARKKLSTSTILSHLANSNRPNPALAHQL